MRAKFASCVALIGALATVGSANAQSMGASVTIGTTGPGVMVSTALNQKLNLRAGGNFFSYAYNGEQTIESDQGAPTAVGYNTDAKLMLVGGALDYHPFGGAFRMSAGAYYNGMEGNGVIALRDNYTVQSRTYTPEEVGEMAMKINFDSKVAPFASIGFGNAVNSRFGFTMEMGAMYMGAPAVELNATGMLEPMEEEAAQIEENLNWAKIYPVFSLGITTRLF